MTMNVKIKEITGSRKILEIEIPVEKIIERFSEVYDEIQKTAELPGFRIGKAPRYLIETHYKKDASEEVKKRLISNHLIKAVEDTGVQVIGSPFISDVRFDEGLPLTFKAEVNVRPEFKLKTYKGIKVKKEKVEVSTDEVDKVIEELRDRYAQLKDVEGRPAKEGDWCLCDVEISADGKPGKRNDGVWFPLNPQSTKPEFLSQLTGVLPGETKTVKTVLPANYPDKDNAGKEAAFIISVRQVKEKILPVVDDDFAKTAGSFKSVLELRGNIREELTAAKERQARFKMEDEIISYLIKSVSFDAPVFMVDAETERLLQEARLRLEHMGYKKEDIVRQEPAMKQNIKEDAIKKVKGFFMLEKIAELEAIGVTEEDLNKRIELVAARSKRGIEDTKRYLDEKDLMDDVRLDIAQDKALEFLVANAKVSDE